LPRYSVTISRKPLRDKVTYIRAKNIDELKDRVKYTFGSCILYVYGTDKMQYARIRRYRL